jgi:ParB-like chromosome segregation protein Spo0J
MSEPTRHLEMVPLEKLRGDGGTQLRVEGNSKELINRYAQLYDGGADALEPLQGRYDGKHYWISDGHQRLEAAHQAGLTDLPVMVAPGSQSEAVTDALKANSKHGAPRSQKTIEAVIEKALDLFPAMSDAAVAARADVSRLQVLRARQARKAREQAAASCSDEQDTKEVRNGAATRPAAAPQKRVGVDGVARDVSKIGRSKTPEPRPKAMRDATGREVPESLRDTFADVALPELVEYLKNRAKEIVAADLGKNIFLRRDSYPWINQVAAEEHLDEALAQLRMAWELIAGNLPHAVCPRCEGAGGECDLCKTRGRSGCGYLPKWRYDNHLLGVE